MRIEETTHSPVQLRMGVMAGPHRAAIATLLAIVGFLVIGVVWAAWAELDEVTTGRGQVIPSSEIQIVQNLEGGIVAELLTREGATVKKGQVLLKIDDTSAASKYRQTEETYYSLLARALRFQAEAEGRAPNFPPKIARDRTRLATNEGELYETRQAELSASIRELNQQRQQRLQELEGMRSRLESANKALALAQREVNMTRPMVAKGLVSQVTLLRLDREVNNLDSKIKETEIAVPKAEAAISEADEKMSKHRSNFRATAQRAYNEVQVRLNSLKEELTAKKDRVVRADVRSPVNGIVKQLLVNTVGGVVQPGAELARIVPIDDTLLVKAKISPKDVAFVHPGQRANVKLSAYDFSIYGGLEASLEQIGSDTITDERGQSYYEIKVRTKQNHLLDPQGKQLRIIPGMVADVDILTGKRTVLNYLLKPFKKARHRAMRER
jgi:adhesin transport system membrane fusion protein